MAKPTTIPTVDLNNFPEESKKLMEACGDLGCFRVTNHKIPLVLMADMKSVFRSLIDLPTEIKMRNVNALPTLGGYIRPGVFNRAYESLGLYDTASNESIDIFCSRLDASEHQRDVICAYAKAVQELAVEIATKIAEGLGVITDDSFQDWPCQFRMNKYNFTPANVGSDGVGAHTDSGFLTILQDDENVGGLEVMDKTGSFVPVEPLPGTFLAVLGDIGVIWSNGRFRNVKDRVVCKEATVRVSIATFLMGPRNANVEAPKELIDDENPRLYRPIALEDFRNLRVESDVLTGGALERLRISP